MMRLELLLILALPLLGPRPAAAAGRAAVPAPKLSPGTPAAAVSTSGATVGVLSEGASRLRAAEASDDVPSASNTLRMLYGEGTPSGALATEGASAAPLERPARFNEVFRGATHNSYWVKRANVPEPYASGAQERLLDQLLFDHVRALEIDIHKIATRRGQWAVYHTDRTANVFCSPFTECLKQLRQFQYALPDHEAVTVVIELKQLLGRNWDKRHTPRDFDALLENALGPHLYRPRDLLARCAPGANLKECVAQKGWPSNRELRGKFLFAVLGNWRWCTIGHGGSGWAEYSTWNGDGRGAVGARSAWPMATDISDLTKGGCGSEYVPPAELKAAYDASVLLQVENFKDPRHMEEVGRFLANGGVVRAGDSFSLADQRARVGWGAQMFQTDYPWVQYADRGPAEPLRPFQADSFADPAQFKEPGERLALMRTGPGGGYAFASKAVAAESDWETLPSTTRPSPSPDYPNPRWTRGKACLRAEGGGDFVAVCRQTAEGRWNRRKPRGEDAVVTVETRRGGKDGAKRFLSAAHSAEGGIGDQVRLRVQDGPGGGACATAYSAAEIGADGRPKWTALSTECFTRPLGRQGLSAQWGDVLFVGTRVNGAAVAARSLSAPPGGSGYALSDLSVAR